MIHPRHLTCKHTSHSPVINHFAFLSTQLIETQLLAAEHAILPLTEEQWKTRSLRTLENQKELITLKEVI